MDLIVDCKSGIYAPMRFINYLLNKYDRDKGSLSEHCDINIEDIDIVLQGPEHEFYHDAWQEIVDNFCDEEGYFIYEYNGDIFLALPNDKD